MRSHDVSTKGFTCNALEMIAGIRTSSPAGWTAASPHWRHFSTNHSENGEEKRTMNRLPPRALSRKSPWMSERRYSSRGRYCPRVLHTVNHALCWRRFCPVLLSSDASLAPFWRSIGLFAVRTNAQIFSTLMENAPFRLVCSNWARRLPWKEGCSKWAVLGCLDKT